MSKAVERSILAPNITYINITSSSSPRPHVEIFIVLFLTEDLNLGFEFRTWRKEGSSLPKSYSISLLSILTRAKGQGSKEHGLPISKDSFKYINGEVFIRLFRYKEW